MASGGSPIEIGSDYGGSIRVPSAFCGTVGIKPTMGRVPRTGHIFPMEALLIPSSNWDQWLAMLKI
ncbi:MAG: hypothetical protein Ct9H300mP27_08710 [Chloroflexota bacterium]|nr:MAG: hypothetical protein Ct9H300mP27_08710 [Chloroflexota bacterium]